MKRKGRSWWTFGGKLHVEQHQGLGVAYCGRILDDAAPATHPATWREACRHCVIEILRAETPHLQETAA